MMPVNDTEGPRMTCPAFDVIDLASPWVKDRETVLLHHGVGSTSGLWAEWLPALIGRYRIIRFDMRGFGRSKHLGPGSRWTTEELTGDISRVIEAAGVDTVHLVGESIGATLALAFTLREPKKVSTLTLCNGSHVGSSVRKVHEWRHLIQTGGVAAWSSVMMTDRFQPDQISRDKWDWYEREQADQPPEAILGALSVLLGADFGPQLEDIRVPVLLMHGDSSPFVPIRTMLDMKERIPNAEMRIFNATPHGLPFVHASECANVLADFLMRRSGRPKCNNRAPSISQD